jgi:hypothetical protein
MLLLQPAHFLCMLLPHAAQLMLLLLPEVGYLLLYSHKLHACLAKLVLQLR